MRCAHCQREITNEAFAARDTCRCGALMPGKAPVEPTPESEQKAEPAEAPPRPTPDLLDGRLDTVEFEPEPVPEVSAHERSQERNERRSSRRR